jgi:hypothetical protein
VLRLDFIGRTSFNKTHDSFRRHERAHHLGHECATQRPVTRCDLRDRVSPCDFQSVL